MTSEYVGKPWWGKYRGTVTGHETKSGKIGALMVSVPTVFPDGTSVEAMPCVPYAGRDVGFFILPTENSHVWIEFEQGDPDYPIWTGCYWGDDETGPVDSPNADIKVLRTKTCTLTLNDVDGEAGITLETAEDLKLTINGDGIELTTGEGSLKLSGSQLSVNDGALEVD